MESDKSSRLKGREIDTTFIDALLTLNKSLSLSSEEPVPSSIEPRLLDKSFQSVDGKKLDASDSTADLLENDESAMDLEISAFEAFYLGNLSNNPTGTTRNLATSVVSKRKAPISRRNISPHPTPSQTEYQSTLLEKRTTSQPLFSKPYLGTLRVTPQELEMLEMLQPVTITSLVAAVAVTPVTPLTTDHEGSQDV